MSEAVPKLYVEPDAGGYRVAGSRVSLASIVHEFRRGATPEAITEAFPVLALEQVYGAIAFYLAHRDVVEREIEADEHAAAEQRLQSRQADPELYERWSVRKQRLRATDLPKS